MALIARVFLAAVFLAAAIGKLGRSDAVAATVRQFGMVPRRWVGPVARWLPWAELGCGLLLAAGVFHRWAALVAGLLLTAFTVGLARSLLSGRSVRCGCFGTASNRPATWWTVARNAGLLVAATLLVASPRTALSLEPWSAAPSDLGGADALALVVTTTALLLAGALMAEVVRLWRGGERP